MIQEAEGSREHKVGYEEENRFAILKTEVRKRLEEVSHTSRYLARKTK